MLSKEQNDLLTQTGPGTPGGKFLRSYWHPIATAEEMPEGGDPLPITIMSEKLVLFRDENNRLGLIQRHCPHRGTDLSYGRIEDGGLRCLYHGWLFTVEGKCIEQPAERKSFCDTVPVTSYPVQEKGGAIWAYLGEGKPPLIPDFEFLTAPEPNRICFRVVQMCNWLQGLESSTDPVHTTFLHRLPLGNKSPRSGNHDIRALRGTEAPEVSTEQTSFGTRIFALHDSPQGGKYLRVNNYVYPCGATPSTSTGESGYQGRWYVPIDDHSHCRFEFIYRHSEPLDKEALRGLRDDNVAADLRHVRREENRYLQDRSEQKTGGTFCGMGRYFAAQDAFAIESQGPIQDRTREYLGSSDMVIVSIRRTLLKAIEQVQAGREAPGLLREGSQNFFSDFICTAGNLEENENGPQFCRRLLAQKAAAE
jgi:phthalate 4,5-dioxygenase oxygenase subunit